MNVKVKELIDVITAHAEAIKDEPAKEVLRLYKYNIVPSHMGALWNTAFTCQALAEGDMRQLNAYMLFAQVRLCDHENWTLEHLKDLFRESVPLSANFLATCGFEELWDDVQAVMAVFDLIDSKEDYKKLLDAL